MINTCAENNRESSVDQDDALSQESATGVCWHGLEIIDSVVKSCPHNCKEGLICVPHLEIQKEDVCPFCQKKVKKEEYKRRTDIERYNKALMQSRECLWHPGVPCRTFCLSCGFAICKQCKATSLHDGHRFKKLSA